MLFVSPSPLTAKRMADAAGTDKKKIIEVLRRLKEILTDEDRGFQLQEVAGAWQLYTHPDCVEIIGRLSKPTRDSKLTQAALDTLTIIAYRQPVIRADVESIRGVAVGPILKTLVERDLVRIVGRADVLGKPFLYGTTRTFLRKFGLGTIADLPKPDDPSKA